MEKVFQQIDNLFVNGVINGIISIVIAGIVLIAINKLLNKFIKKKWPDNYVLQKRIKKIILITIFLAIICGEVTAAPWKGRSVDCRSESCGNGCACKHNLIR